MRNPIFDIMKGIAIVSMIVGHCFLPDILRKCIFIWHMPLFFFISGYFFKPVNNEITVLRKNTRSLILPYIVTCLFYLFLMLTKDFILDDVDFYNSLVGCLVGSAVSDNSFHFFSEYSVGATWFLLALFWTRTLYNYIRIRFTGKVIILICIMLSVIAIKIENNLFYIPTNVLQGISALPFYCAGNVFRENLLFDKFYFKVKFVFIAFIFFLLSLFWGGLEIALCKFECYPLDIIGGISGIYLIYCISKYVSQKRILAYKIAYIGRISILVLCVHAIESRFPIYNKIVSIFDSTFYNFLIISLRCAVDVLSAICLVRFNLIKRFFNIR